ncbi:MAG: serine--tRNA ligase, partial [Patescibacteria group bacterium]
MIDIKLLREQPEEVKKALKKKHVDPVQVDNILMLDAERRNLVKAVEDLQAKRNNASKKIPQLKGEEKEKVLGEMQFVKERMGELEPKLKKMDEELNALVVMLPNPPSTSVPAGKDDSENQVIETVGKPPKFDFEPLDHLVIGEKLGI